MAQYGAYAFACFMLVNIRFSSHLSADITFAFRMKESLHAWMGT